MAKVTKEMALDYHSQGKPGKIEIVPTKPYSSQMDLSLAYSPGVAYPCLEIEEDAQSVYNSYILNEYYDWVRGNDHEHEFVAERVGLDLNACRDDEVNYTINLDK